MGDEEDDEDEDLDEYAIATLDISQSIKRVFLDTLMMKILPTRFVDLQLSFWVHLLPPDPSCLQLFILKSHQLLFRDLVTVKRLLGLKSGPHTAPYYSKPPSMEVLHSLKTQDILLSVGSVSVMMAARLRQQHLTPFSNHKCQLSPRLFWDN